MRTTFVALVGLCAASLLVACDDDKKPTETAPSATVSAAAAPTTPPPPPKAKPAEAIAKALKSFTVPFNAHDAAAVAALMEPNGKVVQPGFPDLVGRDAIAKDNKDTFAHYTDAKVTPTRTFTNGNTAVIEWTFTGKHNDSKLPVGFMGASVLLYDDEGLIK